MTPGDRAIEAKTTREAASRGARLLGEGRHFEALATVARSSSPRGSVAALERALEVLRGASPIPEDDERCCRRILGDGHAMMLRLDEAIPHLVAASDTLGLTHLLGLALDLGRPRTARRLLGLGAPLPAPEGPAWERFLLERALPQVSFGGSAEEGFRVDENAVAEIAAELGVEPAPLLARTARAMIALGSRHIAKLYVYARLAGDEALARSLEPEFELRALRPRGEIEERLAQHLEASSGRLLGRLQEGDTDAYNPLSASLFRAELDGRPVVIKEHLRLPIDPTRVDGYSEELEVLRTLSHPHVVRLLGTISLPPHELLVLEHAPGVCLDRHARRPDLLGRSEALEVVRTLARVLAHLHAHDVVYLDVKAKNLLYEARGPDGPRLTLIDFGMARRLAPGQTEVRTLLSTPAYVAPETARGLRASFATDVFQLGVLLCELVSGQHPFLREGFLEGDDARESELVGTALPGLHCEPDLDAAAFEGQSLQALLLRMLARDPVERPSAGEVADVLDRIDP